MDDHSFARLAQDEIDAFNAIVAKRNLLLVRSHALTVLTLAYPYSRRAFHREGIGSLVLAVRAAAPALVAAYRSNYREWDRAQFLAEEAERHRGYAEAGYEE